MEHPASPIAGIVWAVTIFLLVAAGVLALTKKVRLPFTVALVLIGIGLAQLAAAGPAFLHRLVEYELSPDLILFVFLPTLIFESAFNLDARQLRRNLAPVLTLAVPGLLLSTALIGLAVWRVSSMDLPTALLLGAILSATDPVAVIALFKQLGAPRRLTVLVEGESLFNDATSIVLAKILVGVALAGTLSAGTALGGVVEFFVVFLGGIVVGFAAAYLTGQLLGRVRDDPYIEISLTTILAYLSFLVAEEVFHVSGVMAVVAAGVTLGGWGRTKISPSITGYVDHFWEYMAFVANALIFLMVGLRVDLGALAGALGLLGWVILAMVAARAIVVFGLVPMISHFSAEEPIDTRYQAVMWWGGLRGAIALALALSLGELASAQTIVAIVTGAVLFTLLVPGLTIEALVRRLGLDEPPLSDRFARLEGILAARRRARSQLPGLQRGGLFSARIADKLERHLVAGIQGVREELDTLRQEEVDASTEEQLLFLRAFGIEKASYYEMFAGGHVSERAYRGLIQSIQIQADSLRHDDKLPPYTVHPPGGRLWTPVIRTLDRVLSLSSLVERVRTGRTAVDYEEVWGRHQGSGRVLQTIDAVATEESVRPETLDRVRSQYDYWHMTAKERLDITAEQFPEFVYAMQEQLAWRMALNTQMGVITEESRTGVMPPAVAEPILDELSQQVHRLRGGAARQLRVDPSELLRTVPFFQGLPRDEFAQVADKLRSRTIPAGEAIIRQGEGGDSMFLIARGVVRVSVRQDGKERDLATLLAGDFFGEMALLHGEPRTATCRAVTPCALHELRREDFDEAARHCPAMQEALERVEKARRAEL